MSKQMQPFTANNTFDVFRQTNWQAAAQSFYVAVCAREIICNRHKGCALKNYI